MNPKHSVNKAPKLAQWKIRSHPTFSIKNPFLMGGDEKAPRQKQDTKSDNKKQKL